MATLKLRVVRVWQFMQDQGWSEREMAGRMEITPAYLNRILSGQRQVGNRAVAGFCLVGLACDEIFTVVRDTPGPST